MSSQKIYGLCGLKHHIVDITDHVTRRDGRRNKQGKIELLSQWKLEAEFRKKIFFDRVPFIVALNKIDKPGSNLEAVAEQLKEEGVLLEDQGGEVEQHNLCNLYT